MRTLFVKIFVGFWVALASLVVMVVVLEGVRRSVTETATPEWVALHARHALAAFERGGREELARHAEEVRSLTGARTLLINGQGTELSGSRLEPEIAEIVRRVATSGRPERANRSFGSVSAYPVDSAAGEPFVYVRVLPRRRLARVTLPSATAGWPLALAGVLTAGVVCWWLARHLTAPIRDLEAATRRLAAGDLSARVGPSIQNRQDEIASLGRRFDHMAERLERFVESQQELLRNVSHELRSPLARLNMALGLARQTAAGSEHLDRIELEAERLNDLIGRLLTLSRLEAGDVGDRRELVDLTELICSVVDDANYEAGGTAPTVHVQSGATCHVRGVASVLRSAVDNVVRNAIRHSPDGTPVDVSVESRMDVGGATCIVRVRDHGHGVPEAELGKLFRPFHRLDAPGNGGAPGAGLGLAIARRAVELHGGRIEAWNDPGGGLVVEIVFPPADDPSGAGSPGRRQEAVA